MKLGKTLLILLVLTTIGITGYSLGKDEGMRICPKAQQGQRFIYSEQREHETLCYYASGWNFHGRNKTKRKSGE